MSHRSHLVALALLWAAAQALAGEARAPGADFEEYLARLRAVVSARAKREAEFAAWCRSQGLAEAADAALARARACDPAASEPAPPRAAPPTGDLKSAHVSKVYALRAATGHEYAALSGFCREKGLLYECRRCVGRALAWNPRDEDARRLAALPTVKGGAPPKARKTAREGVWLGERWVPLEEYEKSARIRVQYVIEERGKVTGLAFQGDFLPGVDIFYTTPADELQRNRAALERYFAVVEGRFFLSHPAKPLQFYLIRGPEELGRLGVNPNMMGAYQWGKGRLFVYPNPMGLGTVLHEMTHALLEANFKTFPPLWMNEGIACFFEDFEDLAAEEPFGCLNWRDEMHARAVAAGKARTLEALLRECALQMIDVQGYAHGRVLMNYLWTLGELEAFVIAAQLSGRDADFGAVLSKILRKPIPEIGKDLDAFAKTLVGRAPRIARGTRADEAIDAPMSDMPEVPDTNRDGKGK